MKKICQTKGLHEGYTSSIEHYNSIKDESKILDFESWREIRQLYPLEESIVYLNSGTEGSMSKQVLKQYQDYLEKWASSPSYYFAFDKIMQDWQKINRAKIANFISTKEDNICLTGNTTMGIGMTLIGLNFNDGDEVIVSLDAYPSLISTLNFCCQNIKLKYKMIPLPTSIKSKEEIIGAVISAITNKTKAICLPHVTYTTGLQLPVKEICELAQEKNAISLIDGAQAIGVIPLNIEDMGCDFYAAPGHKWINGPPGTGILYIRNANENKYNLKPILSELYGYKPSRSITDMLQIRGCNNTPGFTALTGAIHLNESIGKEKIYTRILKLSNYLKEKIIEQWGDVALLSPYGNGEKDLCSGITTFVPSKDFNKRYDKEFVTEMASRLIDDYKIWIRYVNFIDDPSVTKSNTWGLRVSTNLFNNYSEIDKLINTLINLTSRYE
ncbi:hypothetical protein KKHLCK_17210 [Candidatus Electrothrix laxa]